MIPAAARVSLSLKSGRTLPFPRWDFAIAPTAIQTMTQDIIGASDGCVPGACEGCGPRVLFVAVTSTVPCLGVCVRRSPAAGVCSDGLGCFAVLAGPSLPAPWALHRLFPACLPLRSVLNAVASVPLDGVTFANVIKPLADLDAALDPSVTNATVLKDLASDKETRDAAVAGERVCVCVCVCV